MSVLLATRDRHDSLRRTLAEIDIAAAALAIPTRVHVVDDGSRDDSPKLIAAYSARPWCMAWRTEGIGKAAALNRARIEAARADLVVFTDDDVVLPPDWLVRHWAMANQHPACDIFCGPILPVFPLTPSPLAALEAAPYWDALFAAFSPSPSSGFIDRTPYGPNFSVRGHWLRQLAFNPAFGPNSGAYVMGQETEFLRRMVHRGARIHFDPHCIVGHCVREDQLGLDWAMGRVRRAAYAHYRDRPEYADPRRARRDLLTLRLKRWRDVLRLAAARQVGAAAGVIVARSLKIAQTQGRLDAIGYCLENVNARRP